MLSKIIAFLSKDSSIKEITNGSNLLIFIAAFITTYRRLIAFYDYWKTL